MPTLRWSDVNWTESAGQVSYGNLLVTLEPRHIDLWKEDPDARFGMRVGPQTNGTAKAELVRVYPSL